MFDKNRKPTQEDQNKQKKQNDPQDKPALKGDKNQTNPAEKIAPSSDREREQN